MRILIAALALLLSAAHAHAETNEAALRTAGDMMLSLSNEDYRDLAKANGDARWARYERPALLNTIYTGLASARYRAAVDAGLDPELTKAGRSIAADAESAAVEPALPSPHPHGRDGRAGGGASFPPTRTRRSRACSPPSTTATSS